MLLEWTDHRPDSVIIDVIPLETVMIANFSGHDAATGRQLLLYHVSSANAVPDSLDPDCQYFVAMLVCNARNLSVDEIAKFARKLIDNGCAYFCCWGDDCERVHDIFDEEWVGNGFDNTSNDTIMTTWHADDTLEEFVEFSLLHTRPTSKFENDCNALIAIVIDDAEHASTIQSAFAHPVRFCNSADG